MLSKRNKCDRSSEGKQVRKCSLDKGHFITESIQNQFGESDYGKNKYSKSAMFWIGYMYRYLSYTRGVTTKFLMGLFPYKQLNDVYYSFHTQDPEWCVHSLLEMNDQSEDVFDNNLRLKAVISARGEY